MDFLETCYISKMILYADRPDLQVSGRWYWCPPGAINLPIPTVFGASCYDPDYAEYSGVGEVRPLRFTTWQGTTPEGYDGQRYCGTPEVWLHGEPFSAAGLAPIDALGRYLCCRPPPILGGGTSEDGAGPQGTGLWLVGSGGDSEDGSGPQWIEPVLVGSGGDSEDGTGPQHDGYALVGSGGDGDNGTGVQGGDNSGIICCDLLANGLPEAPELIFADGDCISIPEVVGMDCCEPLANGDVDNPALIFADGDVIMVPPLP